MSENEKTCIVTDGIAVLCGNECAPVPGFTPVMEMKTQGIVEDEDEKEENHMSVWKCDFCGAECCVIQRVMK